MKFWQTVPLKLRLWQSLYVRYLEGFNFKGLFEGYRSEDRRWPGVIGAVIPWILRICKLVGYNGKSVKKYLSYFGHYYDQYAYFGLR